MKKVNDLLESFLEKLNCENYNEDLSKIILSELEKKSIPQNVSKCTYADGTYMAKEDRRRMRIVRKNIIKIEKNDAYIKFINQMKKLGIEFEENEVVNILDFKGEKTICAKIYKENVMNISIIPCKNGIEISRFETYHTGKGLGSIWMNRLRAIAVDTNVDVYLIPGIVGVGPSRRDDTDLDKLREFYHNHGFKREANSRYWKLDKTIMFDKTKKITNE